MGSIDGTGLIAVQTHVLHASKAASVLRCGLSFAFYSIGKVRKIGLGGKRRRISRCKTSEGTRTRFFAPFRSFRMTDKLLVGNHQVELGVMQMQISMVDTETLLDAREHPEKWPNLLVKVAGYSARFVDLTDEEKDEIIARTSQRLHA